MQSATPQHYAARRDAGPGYTEPDFSSLGLDADTLAPFTHPYIPDAHSTWQGNLLFDSENTTLPYSAGPSATFAPYEGLSFAAQTASGNSHQALRYARSALVFAVIYYRHLLHIVRSTKTYRPSYWEHSMGRHQATIRYGPTIASCETVRCCPLASTCDATSRALRSPMARLSIPPWAGLPTPESHVGDQTMRTLPL